MKYRVVKKTWKRLQWYQKRMTDRYEYKYLKGYRRDMLKFMSMFVKIAEKKNVKKIFGKTYDGLFK